MVKIKTYIISCVICLLLGGAGTGAGLYIYYKKSISKYEENIKSARDRIDELSKKLAGSQTTIDSLTKELDIIRQSGGKLEDAIKRSAESNSNAINRCRELDKIFESIGHAE